MSRIKHPHILEAWGAPPQVIDGELVPAVTAPMSPDRFGWCLAQIGWSPRPLSRYLGARVSACQRYLKGDKFVPSNLADWMNELAEFHWRNKLYIIQHLPRDLDVGPVLDLSRREASEPPSTRPMSPDRIEWCLSWIGWDYQMFSEHSGIGLATFWKVRHGEDMLWWRTADWLDLLADFHRQRPYPLDWKSTA